ncbi:MAG: DUF309 domain-containing protein [Bryobacterales bacterium]|nr:DUF309 domain-containing protein [Bryobacterales bacterium]
MDESFEERNELEVDPAGRVRHGIGLFNAREYFECHEVLELEWVEEKGPRRLFLQALIHFAVGLYHAGRGNYAGADGQIRKGLRKMEPYLPRHSGIDTASLQQAMSAVREAIRRGERFEAPAIVLTDQADGC